MVEAKVDIGPTLASLFTSLLIHSCNTVYAIMVFFFVYVFLPKTCLCEILTSGDVVYSTTNGNLEVCIYQVEKFV